MAGATEPTPLGFCLEERPGRRLPARPRQGGSPAHRRGVDSPPERVGRGIRVDADAGPRPEYVLRLVFFAQLSPSRPAIALLSPCYPCYRPAIAPFSPSCRPSKNCDLFRLPHYCPTRTGIVGAVLGQRVFGWGIGKNYRIERTKKKAFPSFYLSIFTDKASAHALRFLAKLIFTGKFWATS